ncbi:AMP-binding protein [Thauera sp. WH-1]|uniref:AMP-binding protein n=1 Tax=Thauera sp. WH-1 TaxID=3398230 RepID=UPI0039FB9327
MPLPKAADPQDAGALLALIDTLVRELQPGAQRPASLDSALDRELGLDSLSRVELLARIERQYGVHLPAEVLGAAETPRDLLAAIAHARTAEHGGSDAGSSTLRQALPPAQAAPEAAADADAGGAGDELPEAARSLLEVLDWHLARHPARTHVSFYASEDRLETMSYAELADGAMRVADSLRGLGVRTGDCVAVMLPSGLDFFRCFFGILRAGAVPVPMYPPARPNQLEEHLRRQAGILRNCEAPVLITFDRVRPLARMLAGLSPALAHVTTPAELATGAHPQPGAGSHGGAHPARAGELALIQYTSGSTGDPKGVALSHANLLANIRAWGQAAALSARDVCVSWLPLYHDMGLIGTWLGSLYHGLPLILMSPLDFLARPERWLWAIHRHRGTVTAAPNFAFELCVKRLADQDLSGLDLSSWRLAANGAEPVNPDTLARFATTFAPYGLDPGALMPVYGLAECSVGLCVPPPGRGVVVDRVSRTALTCEGEARPWSAAADGARGEGNQDGGRDGDGGAGDAARIVSCGPALPGHALRIVDGEGRPLPERQVGALEFRGPSATAGYYRNPQASAALFHDGWLATGDHAYLADGELYITGRAKEMIIRAGRNIYPYDLEQAVGELPGVRKGCVAVFGVQRDQASEERLVVVAETRLRDAAERRQLEQRIVAAAMDQLELAPDEIVLAPPHAVLKTSSGKIRRASVRAAYLDGSLGAPVRAAWLQILRLQAASLGGRLRALPGALYAGWAWAGFALLAPLAVLALVGLPRLEQRWAVAHRLARLYRWLCACPLRVEGLEHLPAGNCVVVANHASYADGVVLAAALPRPVRFVAKAEFRANRPLRALFERLGTVFVERFDTLRGIEDAHALGTHAGEGVPLLFFAEGTFGPREGLQAFRLGAFQTAARQGLPVVPVALAGTRSVLRDRSWWPRRGPLAVTVCPPVHPAGEDWHDLLALRDTVRAQVLAHCGERDAGPD